MKYTIKNTRNNDFLIQVEEPKINHASWGIHVVCGDTHESEVGRIESQATYTGHSSYLSIGNIAFDSEGDLRQPANIEFIIEKHYEKITVDLLNRSTSLAEEDTAWREHSDACTLSIMYKSTDLLEVKKVDYDINLGIKAFLDDLGEESFSRPDFEHGVVSMSDLETGWYVEAYINGEVWLCRHGSDEPNRYTSNISIYELNHVLLMLANGKIDELVQLSWSLDRIKEPSRYSFIHHNKPSVNFTHKAAMCGGMDQLLEAIQEFPESLNQPDSEGMEPLHWAAIAGQLDVCEVLIKKGANIGAKLPSGKTPYDLAEHCDDYISSNNYKKIRGLLTLNSTTNSQL